MGWSFRKSFKIGPARLNLSRRGASASVGIPGTGLRFNSRGGPSMSKSSGSGCLVAIALVAVAGLLVSDAGRPLGLVVCGIIVAVFAVRLARRSKARRAEALAAAQAGAQEHARWMAQQAQCAAEQQQQEQARLAHERAVYEAQARAAYEAQAAADRAAKDALEAQEAHARRWQRLCSTYGDETANKIFQRKLWVGAPVAVVYEMFGQPADSKEKVTAKSRRASLRYFPINARSYALKIDVVENVVTGWEDDR